MKWGKNIMRKILLGFFVAVALAGCGQVYDREPVGVGYDNNDLIKVESLRLYHGLSSLRARHIQ